MASSGMRTNASTSSDLASERTSTGLERFAMVGAVGFPRKLSRATYVSPRARTSATNMARGSESGLTGCADRCRPVRGRNEVSVVFAVVCTSSPPEGSNLRAAPAVQRAHGLAVRAVF